MGLPAEFQKVSIFDLEKRKAAWLVRWRVDGSDRMRSFPNKTRADRARRRLCDALDAGERFDARTGFPDSWHETTVSVADFAVAWFSRCAPSWSAKNRDVRRQALMHVLTACCDTPVKAEMLDDVRLWISDACTTGTVTAQSGAVVRAGEWLAIHSLRLDELTPALLRDGILPGITVNLDGSPAKPSTLAKRRSTLSALLGDAYTDGLIPANPLSGMRRTSRASSETGEVDSRSIPTPAEFRLFIMAMAAGAPAGRRHVAYLAATLYTGARPGELAALRVGDLALPAEGFGRAVLSGSHTEASARSGEPKSQRGLKARAGDATRVVSLPPALVVLLRLHLELFPPVDGYVFRLEGGGLLSSNQQRLVAAARERLGWTGSHPFAGVTHYTGRHVFITALIRGHVDAAHIAQLCGNSPAVVWSTYAGVFASMGSDVHERIVEALR